MGADEKPNQKPTPKPARVSLVVRASAHVDEAYTAAGFVSKRVALRVDAADADGLLARHTYLTTAAGE